MVDPLAVQKVRLGVYKGFSIGGKVLERDPADRRVITKLKLNEISLVDRPCNPEAVIDMWKAERTTAPDAPTNAEVIAKAIELAEAAGKRGRHTDFVVKARQALTQPRQVPLSEPPAQSLEVEAMVKQGARNSRADLAHIQAAHDHLAALGAQCGGCGDEDDEFDDEDDDEPAMDGGFGDDADVSEGAADESSGLKTAAAGLAGQRQIDALRRTVARLEKRLEDIAREPAPPKAFAGLARAVTKAEDASPGTDARLSAGELKKYLDDLPDEERGRLQLMAALRQPIPIGR